MTATLTPARKDTRPRPPVPPKGDLGVAPPHGSSRERMRRWLCWFESLSADEQQRVLAELRAAG